MPQMSSISVSHEKAVELEQLAKKIEHFKFFFDQVVKPMVVAMKIVENEFLSQISKLGIPKDFQQIAIDEASNTVAWEPKE